MEKLARGGVSNCGLTGGRVGEDGSCFNEEW